MKTGGIMGEIYEFSVTMENGARYKRKRKGEWVSIIDGPIPSEKMSEMIVMAADLFEALKCSERIPNKINKTTI